MSAELIASGQPEQQRQTPAQSPAFDDVYRAHFARLRRFVYGMTGQAALAEDVAQETLLRAYVRMEHFDLNRPLWPWLKTVATRLVIDHSRSRSRESLTAEPAEDAAPETFDVTGERQLLRQAMQSLPERQRVAVGLRYVEDWKAAEVADAMGLTRVAAEQLLLRARRRLSSEYLALGGEPTRMRALLWPVFVVLGNMRGRLIRLRQTLATHANAQLPASFEGASQMVAAAALGGVLIVGGVALATPRAAPSDQRADAAIPARAFRATADMDAVVPRRDVAAVASSRRASTHVSRAALSRGTRLSSVNSGASQRPARSEVTKVEVAAPVEQAPVTPKAVATKRRSADRYILEVHVEGRAGDLPAGGGAGADTNCSGNSDVVKAACGAVDSAEDALPEDPS